MGFAERPWEEGPVIAGFDAVVETAFRAKPSIGDVSSGYGERDCRGLTRAPDQQHRVRVIDPDHVLAALISPRT